LKYLSNFISYRI